MTNASAKQRLSETELCPGALLAAQETAFARDMDRLRARRDEFVSVACPACRCADAAFEFVKETFEFVRCAHCRTVYMSPRPSPAVMEAYYSNSENYKFWASQIFPASEDARREKVSAPRLAHVLALQKRAGRRGGTLVECGPGFGTFAALAGESGAFDDVIVIEPTPEMAAACRARGITVLEQRVEDALPANVNADVLVAFEVIEHLFSPRDMVARCMELLRPGGLLVLTCPNSDGFDIAYLGAASLAVDAEHVNLFNPLGLRMLLESCGFEVVEWSTPGRLDVEFVYRAIANGAVEVPGDPFMRRVLKDEYETLGWPFQEFLAANGLSSHMWFVARKPEANSRTQAHEDPRE
jgi:2-polyprenyl-3-methyl-5-hydroxy-6-metoxy-1,4-benzoquinol methylase